MEYVNEKRTKAEEFEAKVHHDSNLPFSKVIERTNTRQKIIQEMRQYAESPDYLSLSTQAKTDFDDTLTGLLQEQESFELEIEENKVGKVRLGTARQYAEATILYDPLGLKTDLFAHLKACGISGSILREKRPNSEEFQTKIVMQGTVGAIYKMQGLLKKLVEERFSDPSLKGLTFIIGGEDSSDQVQIGKLKILPSTSHRDGSSGSDREEDVVEQLSDVSSTSSDLSSAAKEVLGHFASSISNFMGFSSAAELLSKIPEAAAKKYLLIRSGTIRVCIYSQTGSLETLIVQPSWTYEDLCKQACYQLKDPTIKKLWYMNPLGEMVALPSNLPPIESLKHEDVLVGGPENLATPPKRPGKEEAVSNSKPFSIWVAKKPAGMFAKAPKAAEYVEVDGVLPTMTISQLKKLVAVEYSRLYAQADVDLFIPNSKEPMDPRRTVDSFEIKANSELWVHFHRDF